MATTTFTFGPGYKNSDGNIWSIKRQVLTLPKAAAASSIFASPNVAASSLMSIALKFRSGENIPANGVYDNIKVVIFKGFNNSYINNGNLS